MKFKILETRITTIKRNNYSFTEYIILTTYWSDGSKDVKETPGKVHFIKTLDYCYYI